jgi:hypothetical protein
MQRDVEDGFGGAIQDVQRHGRGQGVARGRVIGVAIGEDQRQLGQAQHAVGQGVFVDA